jgi:CHAT domain-containing protein/tetratricopeptide (TPR) repeat protein
MSSRRVRELVVLCLVTFAAQAAAPPAELTKEQKGKLAQRDRLVKSLTVLVRKRQNDKAVEALERIAALEKEVLGETHTEVIASLRRLARGRELLEQYVKAIGLRKEILRLQEKRLGKGHWQTTDARRDLQDSRRLAGMSPEDRAALRQAQAEHGRVEQLHQQGRYREAVEVAVKVLAVLRKVLGEKHPDYATSLNNLAVLYQSTGERGKALPLYLEALDLRRQVLGEKHPAYARSLNDLAALYHAMGEHGKALPLYLEARQLFRQVLGERHPDYATSLNDLAMLYLAMGEHGKALPLSLEARRLRRQVLGEKHPHYAASLNNLARLYLAMGEHGKALPLYLEARDLQRQVQGERHPDYATSLHNLATLYQAMGEHGKALPLLLGARTLTRQVQGEKHPAYAASLHNLAWLYHKTGEHMKALPLFLEALRLTRAAVGERHPHYATSLNNLASLYHDMGEHGKALPLYLEPLDLRRQLLGEKHPDYATSLNNLAMLYQEMGEHGKALPLLRQALQRYRKVLGEKHPDYAMSLNNLAMLYHAMGEPGKALPLYRQALAIRKEAVGEKHPEYADSLNNLAMLYKEMGEPGKALPLLLEARDLRRRVQGEKHPHYANSLNNLALLYQAMGEPGKALPLSLETRRLCRQVLGEKHPLYAASLSNLAFLYLALGEPGKALPWAREAVGVLDAFLEDSFDSLGELHRLQLTAHVLHHLGVLLSLQEQSKRPAAERYPFVLAWKGRVARRGRLDRLLLEHPQLKAPLLRLQNLRGRLARVVLLTPQPQQHAAWLKQVQRLTEERDRLEADLARRSSDLRREKGRQRLSPEQLSGALPQSVAFVDLLEYTHQSPPRGGKGNFRGEWRLLAFVLRRGKEPVAIPLGAMQPIHLAVLRWRREVEKPPTRADRQAIARSGQALRRLLWLPLRPHVGQAKTVIVAPDGVLCQFPLAALPGGKAGAFLIEEVGIAQVASGRHLFDLLQPPGKENQAARGLLALGGVDYGPGALYPPLPGARAEADRVAELFRRAFPKEPRAGLSGKGATVQAVRQTLLGKRPRFLHLATHGFFEPPDRVERLVKGLRSRPDRLALWQEQTTTLAGLPLLRSGLALAGANRQGETDDPRTPAGVLTGQDVEGLDLRGCEVAVLSACQTGLGDLKASQGVLGLQRSFHAAGVKAMVTSLWSVHDAATLELMDEFYSRLWGKPKVSRLEALRQAQLAILRDPGRVRRRTEALLADARKRGVPEEALRGPGRLALDLPDGGKVGAAPQRSPEAWWAAFVLSGDWR